MSRVLLCLFLAPVVLAVARAEETPQSESQGPVNSPELTKALKDYDSVNARAADKLLERFAVEKKKLEGNTRLKVEEQIEAISRLDEQRKAFENDHSRLPASPWMAEAVAEYENALDLARVRCEKVFDNVAERFRRRKDLASASNVIREKKRFLAERVSGDLTLKLPEEAGQIDIAAPKTFSKTPSGLKYRILRKSKGLAPKETATVKVNYHGWLDGGAIFDSSYRRKETAEFPVNRVIKGWTEGLQLGLFSRICG